MSKIVVYSNINEILTNKGVVKKRGRRPTEKDLGVLKDAALVVSRGKILWVGAKKNLPKAFESAKKVDCEGLNLFPGFVDCHTHLIFAGDRKAEFEMRNQGMSYQEIAKKGGGILSTMKATRRAPLSSLVEQGQQRVHQHLSQGATTIEVKSGYGLNRQTELKMLKAAKSLKKARVVSTFLGAHAIPKNAVSEKSYLQTLKKDLNVIREQGLSRRVDIFVEKGYFTLKHSRDYLEYAKTLGFNITVHADQLSRTGATDLAVQLQALSADHVICANRKDIEKLASSQTAAVFLPAADFYLQCDYPNARAFIDEGASFALASDYNPGSSPTQNLFFVGLLARLKMKMSLPEVFTAMTWGGAAALGMQSQVGAIQEGFYADFFLSQKSWKQFFYSLEEGVVKKTFVGGRIMFRR